MIINQGNLKTLFTSFRAAFRRGLTGRQDVEEWQQIATLVPSDTSENEYGWLGEVPSLREWVGDRAIKDLEQHDYTIKNRLFEVTVGVPRKDIEDDKQGIYTPIFQDIGDQARLWPNQLVYEAVKNGESKNGYDGVTFFNTAHPEGDGTASNLLGSGGTAPWYLLDTQRPLKPFIFQRRMMPELVSLTDPRAGDQSFWQDRYVYGGRARGNAGYGFWQMALKHKGALSQANFDTAMAEMGKRVNSDGETMGIRPNLLVVPWSLRSAALDLLQKQRIGGGDTNRNFQAVDLIISNYLPNS